MYLSEVYDEETWYVRDCKALNNASKTVMSSVALMISIFSLILSVGIQLVEGLKGSSSGGVLLLSVFVPALILFYFFYVIARRHYVVCVIEDIENDRKIYDMYGKDRNTQLREQYGMNAI